MRDQPAVAFQDHMNQRPIGVSPGRCLNARYKGAGCTRCVDACPVRTIALDAGEPQLDGDGCVQCGVCLHVCPTDVFAQSKAPEATLAQTMAQLPAQPTGLVCAQHPKPDASRLPVAAVVRHGRCLAALSPADLLALSRYGERPLWLDDNICTQCPIGSVQMRIQQTVAAANHLLSAYGRPASLHLHSLDNHSLPKEPAPRPILDGMQPRFTRRGLFSTVRRAVRERAPETAEEAPDVAPARAKIAAERLPQALPKSRRKLLALLADMATKQTAKETTRVATKDAAAWHEPLATKEQWYAGVPLFADVEVDPERCSACGLCARFCPTGALAFHKDGRRYRLDFQASACIDCSICSSACPEDAMTVGGLVDPGSLVSLAAQSLAQGELDACPGCGAPTAAALNSPETPLCYACRKSAGTVRPLQDNAGLLESLRAQIR